MNEFKRLMMSFHTQEKSCLNRLYIDRQIYLSSVRSSEQPVEEEKIYLYKGLSFQFMGTGFRTPQKLILFVFIPEHFISSTYPVFSYTTAYEDYILGILSDSVNHLSEEYRNDKKSLREKVQFFMQPVSSVVQQRNGCIYLEEKKSFRLRIQFQVPLLNGIKVRFLTVLNKEFTITEEEMEESMSLLTIQPVKYMQKTEGIYVIQIFHHFSPAYPKIRRWKHFLP